MRQAMFKAPTATAAVPVQEESSSRGSSLEPESIADVQAASAQRTARINELLSNMTEENVGQKLADFEPLEHPTIQKRHEEAALQIPKQRLVDTPFHPSPPPQYTNFLQRVDSPQPPTMFQQQQLYRGSGGSSGPNEKWMEKMNYMIYLLEQQQNEKTNHITEEFVLYTFLGVFIIFVVDAFSRGGKYVR